MAAATTILPERQRQAATTTADTSGFVDQCYARIAAAPAGVDSVLILGADVNPHRSARKDLPSVRLTPGESVSCYDFWCARIWALALVALGVAALWLKAMIGVHVRLYGPGWENRCRVKPRVNSPVYSGQSSRASSRSCLSRQDSRI